MPRKERYAKLTLEQKSARLERQRKRRTKNPSSAARVKLGVSREEYLLMVEAQLGLCAICGRPPQSWIDNRGRHYKELHLDHDHASGRVRGLLCFSCNQKLGWVENNLGAIASYLRRYK